MDTGSSHNYITQTIIDKLNVTAKLLPSTAFAEMANGQTLKIKSYCKLNFTTNNSPNIIHIDEFRIIPTSNTDMISGMSFIQKNDTIIDIKEGILKINGLE